MKMQSKHGTSRQIERTRKLLATVSWSVSILVAEGAKQQTTGTTSWDDADFFLLPFLFLFHLLSPAVFHAAFWNAGRISCASGSSAHHGFGCRRTLAKNASNSHKNYGKRKRKAVERPRNPKRVSVSDERPTHQLPAPRRGQYRLETHRLRQKQPDAFSLW